MNCKYLSFPFSQLFLHEDFCDVIHWWILCRTRVQNEVREEMKSEWIHGWKCFHTLAFYKFLKLMVEQIKEYSFMTVCQVMKKVQPFRKVFEPRVFKLCRFNYTITKTHQRFANLNVLRERHRSRGNEKGVKRHKSLAFRSAFQHTCTLPKIPRQNISRN